MSKHRICIIIGIVFLFSLALAALDVTALGIAPSRQVVHYNTDEQAFKMRILNTDHKDMNLTVDVQGELAEYIVLPEKRLSISSADAEKDITYIIRLPEGLRPGPNTAYIAVAQLPTVSKNPAGGAAITTTLGVMHEVVVNVPYPGTYAEGNLYVSSGDVNDTIAFTANIINKGTADISMIDAELIIRNPKGEELARLDVPASSGIDSKKSSKIAADWKADAGLGLYTAEFVINYDSEQLILQRTFFIGSQDVEISDIYVNDFKLGTVAKFDVDILNKWNEPIEDVYAEIQIINQDTDAVSIINTSAVALDGGSTSSLAAYWDTRGLAAGNYTMTVLVHYAGKIKEESVSMGVGVDSIRLQGRDADDVIQETEIRTSWLLYALITGLLLAILILIIFYFRHVRPPKRYS